MSPQTMMHRALCNIFYTATSLEEAKQLAEDAMIQYDGDPFGERETADKQRELVFDFNKVVEQEAKVGA